MCSSGGPMADVDLGKLKSKKYKCNDCGNKFKGIGKKNNKIFVFSSTIFFFF